MDEAKTAVVAGGTGGIGEGIVAALMRDRYDVYVPVRPGVHSERLERYVAEIEHGSLSCLSADLEKIDEVESFRDRIIEATGRIDLAVVSVGSFYYGYPLRSMPPEDWNRVLRDNLTTHFNVQRVFVDLLYRQKHGTYIVLTGPEAEHVFQDAEVMSVTAAAQRMMARALAFEAFDSPIRVHVVTSHTPVNTRSRTGNAGPDWITAADLGAYIAGLAAGRLPSAGETVHELENQTHLQRLIGNK